MDRDSLTVFDHVRLDEERAASNRATSGIYRVVGTGDETVTLLRVADADERREHTGELLAADRASLASFEPAENPDGNQSPTAAVAGALDGLAWQFRTFGRSIAKRPMLSALAAVVLLVGLVGEQVVTGPEWAFTFAVFTGSLGLVAVGSGFF